jgi:3-hydroxybutyryl-CoA dehydrogenase
VINNVLIVGCGTMGKGFTVLAASNNVKCTLFVRNDSIIEKVSQEIFATLKKQFKRNEYKIKLEKAIDNISFASDYANAFKDNDFDMVFEAVTETVSDKVTVIGECNKYIHQNMIWATNTSSLSITEIASFYPFPEKLIGLHFFNPISHMELVEVIPSMSTAPDTIRTCKSLIDRVSKNAVDVEDSPGFVVNRLLIPMINEAVHLLEIKVASASEIDKAMKLGAHHPLGPLALADLIGNDVCLGIMESLLKSTGDPKYRPALLLQKMVYSNRLGRKTKLGFFNY